MEPCVAQFLALGENSTAASLGIDEVYSKKPAWSRQVPKFAFQRKRTVATSRNSNAKGRYRSSGSFDILRNIDRSDEKSDATSHQERRCEIGHVSWSDEATANVNSARDDKSCALTQIPQANAI